MKVYHGSYTEIDKIDLFKGELAHDFGRGFYVTNLYQQANCSLHTKIITNDKKSIRQS